MKKFLILGIAAVAIFAMSAGVLVAGPQCGGDKIKTTAIKSTDGKACCASGDAKLTSANSATCNMGDKKACMEKFGMTDEECKTLCAELGGKAQLTMISIKGMTCGSCENSVTTALKGSPGVVKVVKVSAKDGTALVAVNQEKFCQKTATKMISDKGFQAEIIPAVAKTSTVSSDAKSSCSKTCSSKEKAACASKDKAKTDEAAKGGTR